MQNADKHDDIDFFVITKKNTLWLTRLLLIFVLKLIGRHRGRLDRKVSNKVCLNMIMEESKLEFGKERQDLYTAHEIVQIVPLFQRESTYSRFISANEWVGKYLANASELTQDKKIWKKKKKTKAAFNTPLLTALEFFAKKIQYWYIERHKTHETISDKLLAFHPFDYREAVMQAYYKRLKKYG